MHSVSHYNTGVIKVGTDVITTREGFLDVEVIKRLVEQIMYLKQKMRRLVLVTSGAMAAGRAKCGTTKRHDETINRKKMYASAGQSRLMETYAQFLEHHDCVAYQFLLTKQDFLSKNKRRELSGTLHEIFAFEGTKKGLIIANENDPIASEEIRFTDNDQLARSIATMIRADIVMLLTSVSGIQRDLSDPLSVISRIEPGSREYERFVQKKTSGNGTGGMLSKCDVGQKLSQKGITTAILPGREPEVLWRYLRGEKIGTTFLPVPKASA